MKPFLRASPTRWSADVRSSLRQQLRFPGKGHLARLILGEKRLAAEARLQDVDRNVFYAPSLEEPVAFYLYLDGVYEPLTRAFILRRLSSGGCFVDAGANIGVFTVPAARRVGPHGRVLAYEPSPRLLPYLHRNIVDNGLTQVDVVARALYARRATLPFYEAPDNHFGMGSLGAQFHDHPVSVEAEKLDDELSARRVGNVQVLKVDVEGFEASVFEGAQELLASPDAPVVIFEFCDWAERRAEAAGLHVGQSQEILLAHGYRLRRLADEGRYPAWIERPLTSGFEMLVAEKS